MRDMLMFPDGSQIDVTEQGATRGIKGYTDEAGENGFIVDGQRFRIANLQVLPFTPDAPDGLRLFELVPLEDPAN